MRDCRIEWSVDTGAATCVAEIASHFEIQAYADRIVIRQDGASVGEHRRRFGRGETIYDPANSFARCGAEGNLLALHPTVKPAALLADAILDCSARGDIVLDAFLGSGTTGIAAERTGRACYGIELDPL